MRKKLKKPYDLVAEALVVKPDSLNENSAMGQHPNWDSFNHLSVVIAIETNYGISIPDEDLMKYDNMKSIVELYNWKAEASRS